MPTSFASPPARKGYLELPLKRLAAAVDLTDVEHEAIRGLASPRRRVAKGQPLAPPGTKGFHFLLDGWGCKMRSHRPGVAQIFELILPGDVIGWFPNEIGEWGFECLALTNATLIEATPLGAASKAGFYACPGIVDALAAQRRRSYVLLMDQVVRLGSHKAYERIGHLLVELYDRYCEVGLTNDLRMPFPIGQETLGEILGLSSAHAHRTMMKLRQDGHVVASPGWLALPRIHELAERVGYRSSPAWPK